ncbi:MAG TPA: hypothetical protein VG754_09320 [Verrucomicrobiae bacterium]|nr:hypothetical protein [Verrucomicrobiae bacterium]
MYIEYRNFKCNRARTAKVIKTVDDKSKIVRKTIQVDTWITVNFTVVPQIALPYRNQNKRFESTGVLRLVHHRRFTIR